MQFQAICSKGNKKLTLRLTAQNREDARNILHKQWYSIIEIQEVVETSLAQEGNFFFFDSLINGNIQTGKIQSDDIFKAYRKLIEDLKYDVLAIYTVEWMSDDQKKIITAKVKDGYRMYLESIGQKIEEKPDILKNEDNEDFSPQLLKEIEKYGKDIDETILKIQNLLVKNHETITEEQKAVLERIEMELVSIKWMRNVGKMQSTLEDSLKQIGTIELEILKKWMIKEKAKFLAETNKLLQSIGSSEKIQTEEEKQSSLEYKFQSFLGRFANEKKTEKNESKNKIDTNSFIYFKNKRELDIYKKAHHSNDSAIIRALFTGKFSLLKRLLLKRRLLLQNIQIIENRLQNKTVSYTKLVHGFDYYVRSFFDGVSAIGTIISVGLFFYIFLYIILNALDGMKIIELVLQSKSSLFLALFSLFTLGISLIRGWKTMIVIIPCFLLIFSFLSTNF